MEVERICKNCGIIYNSNKRRVFCSESCAKQNIYNNQLEKRVNEINMALTLSPIELMRYDVQRKFKAYTISAESRGIVFNLDINYFKSIYKSNCYYCGDIIDKIGIDRLNSNLGYEIGNVVPCCSCCNSMKMVKSKSIFIQQCIKIAEHQKERKRNETKH